jgi:hypothetical protein
VAGSKWNGIDWGSIDEVIVRLSAAGAVVQDPDDLADLRLDSDLDADRLRKALATTGTGSCGRTAPRCWTWPSSGRSPS